MRADYPLIAYNISVSLLQKGGIKVDVREIPCRRTPHGLENFHGKIKLSTPTAMRPASYQQGQYINEEVYVEHEEFVDTTTKILVQRVQKKALKMLKEAQKFERSAHAPYKIKHSVLKPVETEAATAV